LTLTLIEYPQHIKLVRMMLPGQVILFAIIE